ncbi:hypothetical protein HPB47_011775 [Ixodes persulcatus]|uniref:Uncharacterized protein n=1 Tax=Ixodes persulcatus TaxID=34615 RepID=A0AC60NVF0_IXOPE|nr:hypothetical protein HPB47_011775 [Ixodes persulcatus]
MYYHIRYQGSQTGWMKRIKTKDSKYSGGTTRHLATTEREWARTIRTEVARAGIEDWRWTMQRKQSLQLYRKHKKEPAPYPHYRRDRASALLFQARTGSLLTQRCRFELYGEYPNCGLCGGDEDTVEHILKQCSSIDQKGQSPLQCSVELALGYGDEAEEGGGDNGDRKNRTPHGDSNHSTEATKRHLVAWERLAAPRNPLA